MQQRWMALVMTGLCVGLLAQGAKGAEPVVFGLHEPVLLEELGVTLAAKLDTGADSSSLSARNIRREHRDGQTFVVFDLAADHSDRQAEVGDAPHLTDISLPLAGEVRIRRRTESQHEGDTQYSVRPVVRLTICINEQRKEIDVNLTDRSGFHYPLLIGAHALAKMQVWVDPAQTTLGDDPDCGPALTAGEPQ